MQHQLSVALNVLVEETQVLEGSSKEAEGGESARSRNQDEITMDMASINLLMECIKRVKETYKVNSDSSLDYTW
jgi:hypothetical protein